jgi:hypothetical protein
MVNIRVFAITRAIFWPLGGPRCCMKSAPGTRANVKRLNDRIPPLCRMVTVLRLSVHSTTWRLFMLIQREVLMTRRSLSGSSFIG